MADIGKAFRLRALVIHLSAGTAHAADADAKVLVASVEEAVALGADAVSVHVNVGSATEAAQLADLASRSWPPAGRPTAATSPPAVPR